MDSTGKRTRRDCYLLSITFNVFIDKAIKKVTEKGKADVTIQRERIEIIRFSDDIEILVKK